MMNNLEFWGKVQSPPDWSKKEITGGRLKGFTDINPQWRLLAMTETFGPVGVGWKYTIDKMWTEHGHENHICAFVEISLYYKYNDTWSEAIPGLGGSMLLVKEKNGPYTSDEAFKMALTDALSVSMKALGVGAEIYSGFSESFAYRQAIIDNRPADVLSQDQVAEIESLIKDVGADKDGFCTYFKVVKIEEIPAKLYDTAKKALEAKRGK